jgi:beta-lactamase regulating signal transducer with metallopeptidase domain
VAAEEALLRIASTVPAALGTWSAAAFFLWALRVRDATLRAAAWTWAAVSTALALVGLSAGGVLHLHVVVPAAWPPFQERWLAPTLLAVWAAVAAALVARRAAHDARLHACLAGVAATTPAPADLAADVERAARWIGVPAPRVAACEGDGTAFVAGVISPVLCVPLALWRRLGAAERRAMLAHEMAHVRRRDPLRLRVLSFLVDVLWPALPLRWTATRLSEAWELQADERAVQDGATRTALAKSLVAASTSPAPSGVLAFGGPHGSTVRRLVALRRRTGVVALALQTALVAVVVPWCPGWNAWGVACGMETADDAGRAGVVAFGLGCGGNPLTDALAPRARH